MVISSLFNVMLDVDDDIDLSHNPLATSLHWRGVIGHACPDSLMGLKATKPQPHSQLSKGHRQTFSSLPSPSTHAFVIISRLFTARIATPLLDPTNTSHLPSVSCTAHQLSYQTVSSLIPLFPWA
jgi:hypothetical protein